MTEKIIFAYKLFLSLNISDFSSIFYVKTATPPEKGYPLFPSNPPLKIEILQALPFQRFGQRLNPSPQQKRGREVHTMNKPWLSLTCSYEINF